MTGAVRYAFHHLTGCTGQPEFFVCQNLLRIITSVQFVAKFKGAFLKGWRRYRDTFRTVVFQARRGFVE
ncbi:TPA: hypothetical protein ND703_001917 [Enterobacter hormaechei]|nr:hypothetical protein [Enterobacter hormaechei]